MLQLNRIHQGDCLELLRTMPDESINMCVTSPPYWGLRDYGVDGQIGLEPTLNEYLDKMVQVFNEVRRILKPDGTLWLNIGDAYATGGYHPHDKGAAASSPENCPAGWKATGRGQGAMRTAGISGLKPKDLIMMPARVAIALQDAGWWVRSDIIWNKPNPMPESVTDRPTKAHEYLYLMSKSERYYYDIEAIKEPLAESSIQRLSQPTFDQQTGGEKDYGPESNRSCRKTLENLKKKQDGHGRRHAGFNERYFKKHSDPTMGGGGSGLARLHATERNGWEGTTRNKRTVWTIPIQPYSEAHFATFPPALIEPCILAGCPAEGIVLDPFMGSGTTGEVALRLNRQFIGFELNPEYVRLANQRIYAGCKPLDCFNDTPIKIEH